MDLGWVLVLDFVEAAYPCPGTWWGGPNSHTAPLGDALQRDRREVSTFVTTFPRHPANNSTDTTDEDPELI